MNPAPRPDSFELADYTGVLRRRWWVILIWTILGLLLAGTYAVAGPKTYTATAAVAVTASGSGVNSASASGSHAGSTSIINMDSDAQLVQSSSVAAAAARLMRSSTAPSVLVKDVTVTVPANTQVLQISCRASSASGSARCANAFATSFLRYQRTLANNTLAAELATVQARVRVLQAQIVALQGRISRLRRGSPARFAASIQLTADQAQVAALDSQVAPLTTQQANASGGSVISPATPPANPSSPRKLLVLPSGLVAGLVIGLVLGFLSDHRDKRVHDSRDVERLLGLPVLLRPFLKGPGLQGQLAPPSSAAGHRFTELAHAIATALGEGNHVLAVVGTNRRHGGSLVAANLAASLARTHSEAVLVSAVPAAATPAMFGLGPDRGLAELATGHASAAEVARRPAGHPRLQVITPGLNVPEGLCSLPYDLTKRLFSELRSEARYVVLEVSAATAEADTFTLAEFSDAALVVVEIDKTSRPAVAECLRRLDRLRTTVLGAAVLPALPRLRLLAPPGPSLPSAVSLLTAKPRTTPWPPPPAESPKPPLTADDPADSAARN